ncbi:MAG TPA: AtpZ/AtpI family protein [Candidatus Eremiobacteraceae bacterium]|nr:AtpZ/AtpI family protein [Candidatus Eremiobacteraceae bacterium]
MTENSENPQPKKSPARNIADKSGLALELPFTLVGAVIVGGGLGYFLDKWLHTPPWLMVVFGGLGFFAGVREVIRRLPVDGPKNSNGS